MHEKMKTVTALAALLLLSGCGGGGATFSDGTDSGVPVLMSASVDSSFFTSDSGSGASGGDPETSGSGSGMTVARVHNPEPATMLLWGAGLVGAALSRKRKNINLNS